MQNKAVFEFMENLEALNPAQYGQVRRILEMVYEINPDTTQAMKYGGIMFSTTQKDLGGIFIRKNHISLEFSLGYMLEDPKKILEGGGKYRRHIKILGDQDIKDKEVKFYLEQALSLRN